MPDLYDYGSPKANYFLYGLSNIEEIVAALPAELPKKKHKWHGGL